MTKFSDWSKETESKNIWFKFKDGDNVIRIVSEAVMCWKAFNAEEKKATVYVTQEAAKKDKDAKPRWLMYVFVRETKLLQIMEVGSTVIDALGDYQLTPDYAFDTLPPYDVNIKRTGQLLETKYQVIPARQNTELTDEEKTMIANAESIGKILNKDAVDGIPF